MTNFKYDVCILGGAGHIGLPLGLALANADNRVVLYDINNKALDIISTGKMPFLENGAETVLKKILDKKLFLSNQASTITESYFVIIVIGTPVDEHLNPQFSSFLKLFDNISIFLKDDQHLILRSTVYPGTTEKIKDYLEKTGKKTKISFCPERIAEGKAMKELYTLPQIVSSFNDEAMQEAGKLFGMLSEDIIYLKPTEAELAKLFTNVWRYIQFATANQFYQIADAHGLDFYKIRDAMTYNYPRVKGFPGAGFAAGPCLFKDTMQLAAYSNNNFFLGHAAMLVNEGLPNYVVQKLKSSEDLSTKTVGILGMAFKADSDDKRESLSYKLKKMLEIEANQVLCSDVYIKEDGFVDAETLLYESDIIILAAGHREYLELRIGDDKKVIDVWNFFGNGGSI